MNERTFHDGFEPNPMLCPDPHGFGVRFNFSKTHNGQFWVCMDFPEQRVLVQAFGPTLEAACARLVNLTKEETK